MRLGGFDYILQPAPYSEIEEAVARALQDIKEKEPAEPLAAGRNGGRDAGLYRQQQQPVASAIDYNPEKPGPGYLPGGDRRGDFLKP